MTIKLRWLMFLARIEHILLSDLSPIRWTLGWAGVVLAVMIFITTITDAFIVTGISSFNSKFWALGFLCYGLIKLFSCLVTVNWIIRLFNSLFGLWIWTYLFISINFIPETTVSSALTFFLLLPVICETWLLAEGLTRFKNPFYRGK